MQAEEDSKDRAKDLMANTTTRQLSNPDQVNIKIGVLYNTQTIDSTKIMVLNTQELTKWASKCNQDILLSKDYLLSNN